MSGLGVSLIAGALFGIALAAPPGPMNALIAQESVLRGWGSGFRAGLGAVAADVLFCVLAFLGVVTIVEELPQLRTGMIAIGGLLMCYFAYDAFRDARGSFVEEDITAASAGFRKTFVLALTNPYQILFWLTIGVGLLQHGTLDVLAQVPGVALDGLVVVETGSPALIVGFFVGVLLWVIVYPASLVAVGDRLDAAAPIIALLSGVVLALFGIGFVLDAVTTVL